MFPVTTRPPSGETSAHKTPFEPFPTNSARFDSVSESQRIAFPSPPPVTNHLLSGEKLSEVSRSLCAAVCRITLPFVGSIDTIAPSGVVPTRYRPFGDIQNP